MTDLIKLKKSARKLLENKRDGSLELSKQAPLFLLKESVLSELNATFYEPALCLILQGRKQVNAGLRSFDFGEGELLVISHDVPVVSKITEASRTSPYIALVLGLDVTILRSLHEECGDLPPGASKSRALEVHVAHAHLVDSLYRLVDATRNETDSLILFHQTLREVHFRLLQAPCGGMLRNVLRVNSHANKISSAISLIRTRYRDPLSVADVARTVGMSVSSFFHHFKAVTESTPLQYQKEIRLLEARRLLMTEGESVTLTALKVGYESPSQFSREYLRKFGSNPSSDAKTGVLG